ncbi:hypothetical protein [Bradyrhizobium sp. 199]|uniref:hypothetical protein n=1 Tax=Bradyrhizobium sp. 199 TaxID=2782664 RepID=UPI001FFBF72A|nr:hypothetical protein [Bradyrhizobium sp. 199]MCK1360348.1 hypothetical protein [Bradyrhizobium sp. 199]
MTAFAGLRMNFGDDPVLLIELLQPGFDVAGIVGTKPLKQTKVLRSEFHKGFRHHFSSKPCPTERCVEAAQGSTAKRGLKSLVS